MEESVLAPHTPGDRKSKQFGRAIDAEAEESVLVGRARKGDRKSFDELVGRWDSHVLAFALAASRDRRTARTLYVRTFVEAYRSIRRLPPGMSFRTWVYAIARQITRDALPRHPQ